LEEKGNEMGRELSYQTKKGNAKSVGGGVRYSKRYTTME